MSNLIKYQFVNLKSDHAFVIDPEKNSEKFVPLKDDSRVKIRTLEEVEEEKNEEFAAGVPVQNYDEMLSQKMEETQEQAKKVLSDAENRAAQILSQAREEAEEIRAKAEAEGMEAGRQNGLLKAEEENEQLRRDLLEKTERMQNEYRQMIDHIEPKYVDILCSLIQKLTGVLLADNKDLLLHLIRSSISDMEPSGRYIIRVSSEDVMRVESCRGEIAKEAGDAAVEVQEDKGLAKDECIIEADRQMVDCGFKTQLDNLLTTLRMLVQER